MTPFIPDPGTLFYTESLRSDYKVASDGIVMTLVKVKDYSYRNCIFRCIALDDIAVIADMIYGNNYGDKKPQMMRRADYNFEPVGPEVIKTLDLEPCQPAENIK